MYEIISSAEVPNMRARAKCKVPVQSLMPGQAIRISITEEMSDAEIRKLWGALRVRAYRAKASTGNAYAVTKTADAIYVTCMP